MPNLEEKFFAFHEGHPEVYQTLVKLAREAKGKGKRKIGIGMLWEVMRWQMYLQTKDPDGYKLNNNHRSRYARLIMEQEKGLDGLFEVRRLREGE